MVSEAIEGVTAAGEGVARKSLEHVYGFDDVAIVPGAVTTNPEMVDLSCTLGERKFALPLLAASMDAVVDPKFAIEFSRLGGLAVLHIEGLQTRYDDPDAVLAEIAGASLEQSTEIIQRVYQQPIRDDLVASRIEQIKAGGGIAAVSASPQNTKRLAPIANEGDHGHDGERRDEGQHQHAGALRGPGADPDQLVLGAFAHQLVPVPLQAPE